MNVIYADCSGNIGWKAVGLMPVRHGWDGLLPVPGDGRFEWAGFYATDQLPADANPVRGWLASANEMNVPNDYPADRLLGFDWFAPHRLQRIEEILRSGPMSLADAVNLQADYTSLPAREIIAAIRGCTSREPKVAEALSLLRDWDARLLPDSAAAALFEVWYRRHLRPALLARALVPHVQPGRLTEAMSLVVPQESLAADARVDLALLSDLSWLGPAAADILADIVTATLCEAITDVDGWLGDDWSQWAWGRLHTVRFTHQLSGLVTDGVAQRLNVGTAPRGGSGDTVGNTTYAADFTQVAGSTWRMVIDVGGWDNSLAMNAPGQSGSPDSAHYGDLFGAWSRDGAFPLLYTREQVEAAAEQRIILNVPSR